MDEIPIICISPIVHQTAGQPALRDDLRHCAAPLAARSVARRVRSIAGPAIIFQSPDIIDQVCPGRDSRRRHPGFVGIQGHRHIESSLHSLDYRNHPLDFLMLRQKRVARPGGLAADVDDVRPLLQHLLHMPQGPVPVVPLPSVREGIRGHVQDSHHVCVSFGLKFPVSNLQAIVRLSFIQISIYAPGISGQYLTA